MRQSGICVAGNMIVDILYPIAKFPAPGELTVILDDIERSTGGCLCNVIMDLAMLDPLLPLTAFGRSGKDADGEFIINKLKQYPNIDISRIRREGTTSFTAVMADESTRQRTFFQYRGANAQFAQEDISWDGLDPWLLHIGYLMLLDTLDESDAFYGTKMARLLHDTQQRGIKTSIDTVSVVSGQFSRVVSPSLKYTDYCVINELEAAQITGIPLRDDEGRLLEKNMRPVLISLLEMGVSTWAVVHSPEGGYGMERAGEYTAIPSLKLPEGYIKGSVGAGDAFCAGVIYAAYQGKSLREGLELGIASAACSLSQSSATGGLRSAEDAIRLYNSMR